MRWVALLVILNCAAAAFAVPFDQRIGQYHVQVAEDPSSTQDILVIDRDEQELLRVADYLRFRVMKPLNTDGDSIPIGTDISGDGQPDLAVFGWNGGAHCCFTLWIFSLGGEFRTLAEVSGGSTEPEIRQLDLDPELEVVVRDWAWEYWPSSFGGSPSAQVALDWISNDLNASFELTGNLPSEVLQSAEEIRADPSWGAHQGPYHLVFSRAIELLYRGRAQEAAQFVADAWGGSTQDLVARSISFGRRLDQSDYYQKLFDQEDERIVAPRVGAR